MANIDASKISTITAAGMVVVGLGLMFAMMASAPWALKQEVSDLKSRVERMDNKIDALLYQELQVPPRRAPGYVK